MADTLRSKRGITLTDVVVVVVIALILAMAAAMLFPRRSQYVEHDYTALNNIRQLGHATAMYLTDYDNTMPLAAVLRPDGKRGGSIGTMVAYPFPANDGPELPSPGAWRSKGFLNMAECQVNNSVGTYLGSVSLQLLHPAQYGDLFDAEAGHVVDDFAGPGKPADSGFTFNGDLHRLNTNAIKSPENVIMWWCGNGNYGWHGRAIVQPWLNCGETHGPDTCVFTPGKSPNQGQYLAGYDDATNGEDLFTIFNPSYRRVSPSFPVTSCPSLM